MDGLDSHNTMLESIYPYMLSCGVVPKGTGVTELSDSDFRELALKLKIKTTEGKFNREMPTDQLIKTIFNHTEHLEMKRGGRRTGTTNVIAPQLSPTQERAVTKRSTVKLQELEQNYFGLPIYALNRTAEGIIYQCRKPYEGREEIARDHDITKHKRDHDIHTQSGNQVDRTEHKKAENHTAQRKVAGALTAMAGNDQMRDVFVYKGGVDAVMKLTYDSTDPEVLASCASSIGTVADHRPYALHLLEKQVVPLFSCLIENGDEQTRFYCSTAIAKMTVHEGTDSLYLRAGLLMPLQALLGSARLDTVCFALLSILNIANCMSGSDAEVAIRMCLQGSKRLDFVHEFEPALFVSCLLKNLTRMVHYVPLLCEEGVLPVLISLLECQGVPEVVDNCAEAFFNLSMLRKNRRDIYGSGVSSQMTRMLDIGGAQSRAHTLLMVGNLLGNNLLQDKMMRSDILNTVIGLLVPSQKEQCLAAAFVVSHLSHSYGAAKIMVFQCDVVPKALALLAERKTNSMDVHAVGYLWTALANLAHHTDFFFCMMEEKNLCVTLSEEASSGDQQEIVAQLMLNLSEHPELHELVGEKVFAKVVLSFKTLFIRGDTPEIRMTAISILINLAVCIAQSRCLILGTDLVDILEESGLDDPALNHKFISLLYLISCEAPLCPKLVDYGVQRMLMSVVKTLSDEGKDIVAAVLHNLSLKRALLGTGVLGALVSFLRNCKSTRVLWVSRAIANMSSYPRSRAILAKEKKLVPYLSGIMRTGSQEADRVQHYCALSICNIFGAHLDKTIIESLIKSGTVVDLVVVTLLRVNSIHTKGALGKALFNLLARADFRDELVRLDVLEALIELSRIELTDLLELSVKSVYNISCETARYSSKLEKLRVPHHMIARTILNPELQGTRATTHVKLTCGKAIANMSFDAQLALAMTHEKIAEACSAICNLKSDEARYCSAATVFNISFLDNAIALANSVAVPMLVTILNSGPILCIQLAVATLCNFSLYEVFLDQLSTIALGPLINAISAPHLDTAVKTDCVYFIYNLVTVFEPSHKVAIEEGVVVALQKIIKVHTDEAIICMVGRILKEICTVESQTRKLLADGVMPILLKLAKYEYGTLKLDVASATCSMSCNPDTSLKMLKLEAVEILFWLTLHDCLNLYDPIRKYVARTVRNFTILLEDALYMSKEERFTSVLKVLAKSTNDDVLWHTSVVVYNMLNSPSVKLAPDGSVAGGKKVEVLARECKDTLLKRGVIQLIFDLAASGTETVRHLCSASLHSVADHIPNSDDPAVLQLIMCLLDAEGDMFVGVGDRIANDLPYTQLATPHGTDFTHSATGFTGNWEPMTCEVDNIFKVAHINMEVSGSDGYDTKPLTTGIVTLEQPIVYSGSDFGHFRGESQPASANQSAAEYTDAVGSGELTQSCDSDVRRPVSSGDHFAGGASGKVRFRDQQGEVTGFSDDEGDNDIFGVRSVDVLPRAPPSSSCAPPDVRKKSKNDLSRQGSGSTKPKLLKQNSSEDKHRSLPSITKLNREKPSVPNDTVKAMLGSEYRPNSPRHMVSIQRSFSGQS